MRHGAWLLALALLSLARADVSTAAAQTPGAADTTRVPSVRAGDAATLILQLPAPGGADSASYTLELANGFRAFMAAEGRLGRLDDLFILPISFATPDRLPAGRVTAGRLTVAVDGY